MKAVGKLRGSQASAGGSLPTNSPRPTQLDVNAAAFRAERPSDLTFLLNGRRPPSQQAQLAARGASAFWPASLSFLAFSLIKNPISFLDLIPQEIRSFGDKQKHNQRPLSYLKMFLFSLSLFQTPFSWRKANNF